MIELLKRNKHDIKCCTHPFLSNTLMIAQKDQNNKRNTIILLESEAHQLTDILLYIVEQHKRG